MINELNGRCKNKSGVPDGQSGKAGTSATFQKTSSPRRGGVGVEGRAPHDDYAMSETKPTRNMRTPRLTATIRRPRCTVRLISH